jgi:ABC-type amino acid transport substrate-binding protein
MRQLLPGCTALIAATMVATVTDAAAPRLERIRAEGVVRLGVRDNATPFSYRLPDGRHVGYSVELCGLLAARLRERLKLPALREERVPIASVAAGIEALRAGRIDLECGVSIDNAERRKQVAFAVPHFFSFVGVLVPARYAGRSLAELEEMTIAVPRGTVAARILQERAGRGLARIRLREVATADEGLALLAGGAVAGYANFEVQLLLWRAAAVQPQGWTVVANRLFLEPVALMLPPDDPAWQQTIDLLLTPLMQDGAVLTLYRRWFEQPIPPAGVNLNLPPSELLRSSLRYPVRADL